jgi:hypothetical protein
LLFLFAEKILDKPLGLVMEVRIEGGVKGCQMLGAELC